MYSTCDRKLRAFNRATSLSPLCSLLVPYFACSDVSKFPRLHPANGATEPRGHPGMTDVTVSDSRRGRCPPTTHEYVLCGLTVLAQLFYFIFFTEKVLTKTQMNWTFFTGFIATECSLEWRQVTNILVWDILWHFTFFPPFSILYSCTCKRLTLKRLKSAPTEAPLSHRKHCSWNASSVVNNYVTISHICICIC